ncbi:MAG TPA: UDP-N-acetylmuramoyl-L-alanine--D-glutamate ligase [Candidatus Limnocylindrales bacterium]|nr:UDP-N-acetylmuramoyl-L-alanine--D-glutamate ligase [Candidatus Limnocylindrales bacterium]
MTTAGPIDLDRLTLDDVRAGVFAGRPVTVLGLARSGLALARFLVDAGAAVSVYDGRPADELGDAIAALDGRPVTLALGPAVDPAATWAHADLVATSPSITPDFPTTEPRLRAALRALVDARSGGDMTVPALVSEADLFLRLCPSPTIGVTGTKGKTTTSSLIAAVLAADPDHPVVLGGNIGSPLVERLFELTPAHRVVDELSELQLPTVSRGTTVAVYTNVTSDHLDRHGTLEGYRAVKRRLAELVDPAGALVLNAEDPVVSSYAGPASVRTIRYRRDVPPAGGLGVVDGWIVADDVPRLGLVGGGLAAARSAGRIMPVDELAIPGAHNVSNALAAIAVALAFGVDPAGIRRAAAAFTGVEHRLEPAGIVDGVRFINDSQGTQPDAVIAALRAFDPPVVLIAGGRDKGIDLSALAPVVAERAAAAVLIGESGPVLERSFRAAGLARTERAASLDEAVARADAIARDILASGAGGLPAGEATVLLSPAAASFDMFVDYAARGRAFKSAVTALAATRSGEGDR